MNRKQAYAALKARIEARGGRMTETKRRAFVATVPHLPKPGRSAPLLDVVQAGASGAGVSGMTIRRLLVDMEAAGLITKTTASYIRLA